MKNDNFNFSNNKVGIKNKYWNRIDSVSLNELFYFFWPEKEYLTAEIYVNNSEKPNYIQMGNYSEICLENVNLETKIQVFGIKVISEFCLFFDRIERKLNNLSRMQSPSPYS